METNRNFVNGLDEFLHEYDIGVREFESWTGRSAEEFMNMTFWDIRQEVFYDTLASLERLYRPEVNMGMRWH